MDLWRQTSAKGKEVIPHNPVIITEDDLDHIAREKATFTLQPRLFGSKSPLLGEQRSCRVQRLRTEGPLAHGADVRAYAPCSVCPARDLLEHALPFELIAIFRRPIH